ncbi:MAG: toll/interleukin-1 receptor domain-containing protein [Methanosarcinaceae archaeon]|nr:toll/interleukin-1 receptor domain-containing protein [Methanosarcinaceae archaeon]
MPTKVFISWGGDVSFKLAEALRDWFPSVLQHVKPYFSPDDIQKGTKWDSEISVELEASNIGVICLTRDNIERPWILFEAGALAKEVGKARVCPLLFNLEPAELTGPLANFQCTKFTKDDFKQLIMTINVEAKDLKLDPAVLDSVFEKWWPDINDKVSAVLAMKSDNTTKALRSNTDYLMEILELVRTNASREVALPKFYQLGIAEFMSGIEKLTSLIGIEETREALVALHQMRRPLNNVFSLTGNPEIYHSQYSGIIGLLTQRALGQPVETGPTGPMQSTVQHIIRVNGPCK